MVLAKLVKNKITNNCISIVFVLCLLFNFVFFKFNYISLIFTIISISLSFMILFYSIYSRCYFKGEHLFKNIFLIFLILIINLINILHSETTSSLGFVFVINLIILSLLTEQELKIKRNTVIIFYYFSLFSLMLQLIIFTSYDGRHVLSMGDPNYSAALMFLFLFFSYKFKFYFGVFFAILSSLLFMSRMYFLILILLPITIYFRMYIFILFNRLKINSFITLSILSTIIILVISFYFVQAYEQVLVHSSEVSLSRKLSLDNLSDSSNFMRFSTNLYSISYLISNTDVLIFGLRDAFENTLKNAIGVIPHNGFLSFSLQYGLVILILYLYIISNLLKNYLTPENLPFLFSFLIIISFLGQGQLSGLYLLLFILLIRIKNE